MLNTLTHSFSLDHFPCGMLVTDTEHVIVHANAYFNTDLHWDIDHLLGKKLECILTKGANVFYQSYVIPMLLSDQRCEELQLSILDGNGERTAITLNAKIAANKLIYWSFFTANNRNKLYEELVQAREKLQQQAQRYKSLASIDELTGLLNRREIKARTRAIRSQQAKSQQVAPISMLMLDIDYFKNINDQYGHLEGDRVLKEIGRLLINFGRRKDLIARYGGEEFLITLPNTNLNQAETYAEQLHQAINKILIEQQAITVSIGISLLDATMSFEHAVDRADTALYNAKNAGRNQTAVYY